MPITYNAGTNIITVTGYTSGTPCTFTDVYNADVAGSWGKVTRQCTNQFCFDCGLLIGDGSTSTWFADTGKQVIHKVFNVPAYSSGYYAAVNVKANANGTFGSVMDATNKLGMNGCHFFYDSSGSYFGIMVESTGNLYCYSCIFDGDIVYGCGATKSPALTGTFKAWNCVFNTTMYVTKGVVDINKCAVNKKHISNSYGINISTPINVENVEVYGTRNRGAFSLAGTSGTSTVKNAFIRDCTNLCILWGQSATHNVINADTNTWNVYRYYSGSEIVQKQFEFDLELVDSTGSGISTVKVKLWDKDDSLIVNTSTNASGVLATQTITASICPSGSSTFSTLKTPHEMRIYKYGKSMLSSKSSIEAKMDWSLTMYADPNITQTTEATVAAYTGITINHTTETITISSNHTLDEIYDYCQYDMIAATKQLDQTMHTSDGVNFTSEYSFVVNTGITVTATDQKLSMVAGETYTLTGTAQFTGIIATTTTTRIPIKLTNIIDGSRYWVGKESDGSKIFEGTQSGSGTVTGYYEHTANINIDIRVRKSSASVKYKPWVGEGTLIAEAFSLRIRQIQDVIVT